MAKRATLRQSKAPASKAVAESSTRKSRVPAGTTARRAAPAAQAAERKGKRSSSHGGRRAGAGRKPQLDRAGQRIHAPRTPRPAFKRNQPLVVRLNFTPEVKDLRSKKLHPGILAAIAQSDHPGTFQVVEHHVLAREVRLVVRAVDKAALAAGMRGLGARCSRAVNQVLGTRGSALKERFELTLAETPAQASKLLRK